MQMMMTIINDTEAGNTAAFDQLTATFTLVGNTPKKLFYS